MTSPEEPIDNLWHVKWVEEDAFATVRRVNDIMLGDITIMHNNKTEQLIFYKDYQASTRVIAEKTVVEVRRRIDSNSPGLMRMLGYSITDTQIPSVGKYTVRGFYEFFERTLQTEIELRSKKGPPFSIAELNALCYNILEGLRNVHRRGAAHGDVRPQTIGLDSEKGSFVLIDRLGDLASVEKVQAKNLSSGRTMFVSPELWQLLQRRERGMTFSAPQNDLFALGLCLLSAGNMGQLSNVYTNDGSFAWNVLETYLNTFSNKYSSDPNLVGLTAALLTKNIEDRPDIFDPFRGYLNYENYTKNLEIALKEAENAKKSIEAEKINKDKHKQKRQKNKAKPNQTQKRPTKKIEQGNKTMPPEIEERPVFEADPIADRMTQHKTESTVQLKEPLQGNSVSTEPSTTDIKLQGSASKKINPKRIQKANIKPQGSEKVKELQMVENPPKRNSLTNLEPNSIKKNDIAAIEVAVPSVSIETRTQVNNPKLEIEHLQEVPFSSKHALLGITQPMQILTIAHQVVADKQLTQGSPLTEVPMPVKHNLFGMTQPIEIIHIQNQGILDKSPASTQDSVVASPKDQLDSFSRPEPFKKPTEQQAVSKQGQNSKNPALLKSKQKPNSKREPKTPSKVMPAISRLENKNVDTPKPSKAPLKEVPVRENSILSDAKLKPSASLTLNSNVDPKITKSTAISEKKAEPNKMQKLPATKRKKSAKPASLKASEKISSNAEPVNSASETQNANVYTPVNYSFKEQQFVTKHPVREVGPPINILAIPHQNVVNEPESIQDNVIPTPEYNIQYVPPENNRYSRYVLDIKPDSSRAIDRPMFASPPAKLSNFGQARPEVITTSPVFIRQSIRREEYDKPILTTSRRENIIYGWRSPIERDRASSVCPLPTRIQANYPPNPIVYRTYYASPADALRVRTRSPVITRISTRVGNANPEIQYSNPYGHTEVYPSRVVTPLSTVHRDLIDSQTIPPQEPPFSALPQANFLGDSFGLQNRQSVTFPYPLQRPSSEINEANAHMESSTRQSVIGTDSPRRSVVRFSTPIVVSLGNNPHYVESGFAPSSYSRSPLRESTPS